LNLASQGKGEKKKKEIERATRRPTPPLWVSRLLVAPSFHWILGFWQDRGIPDVPIPVVGPLLRWVFNPGDIFSTSLHLSHKPLLSPSPQLETPV
jgi:hypothetical protein